MDNTNPENAPETAPAVYAQKYRRATVYPFTWGKVVDIHAIGPYEIVEYDEFASGSSRGPSGKRPLSGRRLFHVYVDGEDESRSCYTMEGALVIAIAAKQGASLFAPAVAKLLKLDKELE